MPKGTLERAPSAGKVGAPPKTRKDTCLDRQSRPVTLLRARQCRHGHRRRRRNWARGCASSGGGGRDDESLRHLVRRIAGLLARPVAAVSVEGPFRGTTSRRYFNRPPKHFRLFQCGHAGDARFPRHPHEGGGPFAQVSNRAAPPAGVDSRLRGNDEKDQRPSASGRLTVAIAPPLSRLARLTWPSCRATIARAIARPSPVPPVARLREGSPRTNGSNNRSA